MNLIPITSADGVSNDPGVYIVFIDAPVGWLAWNPLSGPAYVGKADDGLRRRVKKEHVGDTGRSTLRRTLGALLKEDLSLVARPRLSKRIPKAVNFTNFDFEPDGNDRLTAWMSDHLAIEVQVGPTHTVEVELIPQLQPPLNLTGWKNPFAAEIRAARKLCADEARLRSAPTS